MYWHRINEVPLCCLLGECVQTCKIWSVVPWTYLWEMSPVYSIKTFFLHFRQQIFAAFTEEFVAAPFTDQIFHFIIPALADVQIVFPYEFFLNALLLAENGCSRKSDRAPWLFYFVLTVGETYLGEKAIWPVHCFFGFALVFHAFP